MTVAIIVVEAAAEAAVGVPCYRRGRGNGRSGGGHAWRWLLSW